MIEPGPGVLLIAEPFLKDPNFMRTVVLLCDHQEEGSFGFVINRSFDRTLDELMNDPAELKIPVFYGGPVQLDTVHFLHQYPDLIPGGYAIQDGIYWGGDYEIAIAQIRAGNIDMTKIRFFIGYSGWGGGQLNNEMKEKSWLTANANRKLVFHQKTDQIWRDSLKELGGNYEMMANFPVDPQLN